MLDLKSTFFQLVRISDLFLVGPLLLFAATLTRNPIMKLLFLVVGISTIVFNGFNFITISAEKRERQDA